MNGAKVDVEHVSENE